MGTRNSYKQPYFSGSYLETVLLPIVYARLKRSSNGEFVLGFAISDTPHIQRPSFFSLDFEECRSEHGGRSAGAE